MNDFDSIEGLEAFAAEIGVGFQDSMKYAFISGEMTEEKLQAFSACIEDMKECISAFEYYREQYSK